MASARTLDERITDTRERLCTDVDAWFASTNGNRPWLVPLSFLWHAEQLVFATMAGSATMGNIRTLQRVRVALGGLRDVVLIDGNADHAPIATLTDVEAEAYIHKHDGDPRRWADTVIRVVPDRIQAWREENELAGRTLMRDGAWLSQS